MRRRAKVPSCAPTSGSAAGTSRSRGAALLAVLRRFLAAYGPTTPQAFARWWATTPATARQLPAQLGNQVAEVEVAGQRAWLLAGDLEAPLEVVREVVRLLPPYDCFVVGLATATSWCATPPMRASGLIGGAATRRGGAADVAG